MTKNNENRRIESAMPSRALPALLDFWTLCDFVGMPKDRSTRLFAWRGAKNGTFPAPVKLSVARIAWRRDEVEKWLAERPRAIYSKAEAK
jgi:predicted DNA-binding transcriptional regulator AlpA